MAFSSLIRRFLKPGPGNFFSPSPLRTLRLVLQTGEMNLLVAPNFRIVNHGSLKLERRGKYRFGTSFYGFMCGDEKSLIRIRGHLNLQGSVGVAGGAKWDVGPDASLTIGEGTYFSPNTVIVAANSITIGARCAIAWDVQIVDADFHAHGPAGGLGDAHHSQFTSAIEIGEHVWIGSHAKIYKGVSIADGCIVAGGAVVVKSINEPNSLIAGSPARIVKSGVEWR